MLGIGAQVSTASSSTLYRGYDHVTWWVGNAKQAASFWCARYGFEHLAYSGLETGSRDVASHVVRKNDIVFVLQSPLTPLDDGIGRHHHLHGDGVRDIAFQVDDCRAVYQTAIERGATPVTAPNVVQDEDGSVIMATIATFGHTVHTFIERTNYRGLFLPGYIAPKKLDPLSHVLGDTGVISIDHVVGNFPKDGLDESVDYYLSRLGFHRFWSVDDDAGKVQTGTSAFRTIAIADETEKIKMPMNEPATGQKKSQIQEFIDFYGGSGVQHIALLTEDIIATVSNMQDRGVEFLTTPHTYYQDLAKRLRFSKVKVTEDLDRLKELNILVDFDQGGYLLQIFAKPLSDRPTAFIEVIQRHGFNGFGQGNVKALFEAIEREQAERGTL